MATLWTGERRVSFSYRSPERGLEGRDVVVTQVAEGQGRVFLMGTCQWRGATRSFRLDLIESRLVDMASGEVGTAGELFGVFGIDPTGWPPLRAADSADDLVEGYGDYLAGLGWTVVVGEPEPGVNDRYRGRLHVGLYRHYKNGRRLKHPDVWIEYVPEIFVQRSGEDGEWYEMPKPNPRPWRIGWRSGRGQNFESFLEASGPFIEAARSSS